MARCPESTCQKWVWREFRSTTPTQHPLLHPKQPIHLCQLISFSYTSTPPTPTSLLLGPSSNKHQWSRQQWKEQGWQHKLSEHRRDTDSLRGSTDRRPLLTNAHGPLMKEDGSEAGRCHNVLSTSFCPSSSGRSSDRLKLDYRHPLQHLQQLEKRGREQYAGNWSTSHKCLQR